MAKLAIHEAVEKGNTERVKELIETTEDIDVKDGSGHTSLMIAARNGNVEWVNDLIAAGADLEVPSNSDFKWTALMIAAAKSGHTECVRALLEAKARIDIKNDDHKTALMCTREDGHVSCIAVIEEHMKTNN